jgi:acetyl-CoA carboxylase biotin carboxylase subunit
MGVRIDSAVYPGYTISPYYDSMILKVICFAKTRLECIRKMRQAFEELIVDGVKTTTEFDYVLLHHPEFILGHYDTSFIEGFIGELKENGILIQKKKTRNPRI